ncbi:MULTISPECIES: hypothetical protein [unclassified Moorena]|nr:MULTISPECIES: hypothetical protein [unclassified Moorena]
MERTFLTFLWRSRDIPEGFGRYPLDAIASCIGELEFTFGRLW